ncbi:MAG: hypothetical protein IKZ54_08990 [Bacteroidales bacterium]|nr:hypothetical protein [Bacteroidales bacterium]
MAGQKHCSGKPDGAAADRTDAVGLPQCDSPTSARRRCLHSRAGSPKQ